MGFIDKIKKLKLLWKILIIWAIAALIDSGLVFCNGNNRQPFIMVASLLFWLGLIFWIFYCCTTWFKVFIKTTLSIADIYWEAMLLGFAVFIVELSILLLLLKYPK